MQRRIFVAAAILISQSLPQVSNTVAVAKVPGKHKLLVLNGDIVKWGKPELGVGAVVTYALATSRMSYHSARNCRHVDRLDRIVAPGKVTHQALHRELKIAFDAWEKVADIRFRGVDDESSADIVVGSQVVPRGRAFANVSPRKATRSYRRPVDKAVGIGGGMLTRLQAQPIPDAGSPGSVASIEKSLICVNPSKGWKVGFDGDLNAYDLRYTFIHEIGHAIGLDHPGARGEVMDPKYSEKYRSLRAGDIAGAVRLYGPKK